MFSRQTNTHSGYGQLMSFMGWDRTGWDGKPHFLSTLLRLKEKEAPQVLSGAKFDLQTPTLSPPPLFHSLRHVCAMYMHVTKQGRI